MFYREIFKLREETLFPALCLLVVDCSTCCQFLLYPSSNASTSDVEQELINYKQFYFLLFYRRLSIFLHEYVVSIPLPRFRVWGVYSFNLKVQWKMLQERNAFVVKFYYERDWEKKINWKLLQEKIVVTVLRFWSFTIGSILNP